MLGEKVEAQKRMRIEFTADLIKRVREIRSEKAAAAALQERAEALARGSPSAAAWGTSRRPRRPEDARGERSVGRHCILGTRFLGRHCILWKFRKIAPVF